MQKLHTQYAICCRKIQWKRFTVCFQTRGRSGGVSVARFFRATFWIRSPPRWKKGGLLRVATDQVDYFRQMEWLSRAHPQFEIGDVTRWHRHPADETVGWKPMPPDDGTLPSTKFERKFREQGAAIHWLEVRKVSPVR